MRDIALAAEQSTNVTRRRATWLPRRPGDLRFRPWSVRLVAQARAELQRPPLAKVWQCGVQVSQAHFDPLPEPRSEPTPCSLVRLDQQSSSQHLDGVAFEHDVVASDALPLE